MNNKDLEIINDAIRVIENVLDKQNNILTDSTIEEFCKGLRYLNHLGESIFTPYKHQLEIAKLYQGKNHVMIANARQIGITIFNAIFALHSAMCKPRQRICIISNNIRMSQEVIQRAKIIYEMNFQHSNIRAFYDETGEKSHSTRVDVNKPKVNRKGMFVLPNDSTILVATSDYHTGSQSRPLRDNNITIIENLSFMGHKEGNVLVDEAVRNSEKVFISSSVTNEPNAFNELWFSLNGFTKVAYDYSVVPYRDDKWAEGNKSYSS